MSDRAGGDTGGNEPRPPDSRSDNPVPSDVNADRCLNCGQLRRDHRFTRNGAVCVGGRRFRLDTEDIQRRIFAADDRQEADRG